MRPRLASSLQNYFRFEDEHYLGDSRGEGELAKLYRMFQLFPSAPIPVTKGCYKLSALRIVAIPSFELEVGRSLTRRESFNALILMH